MPIIVEWDNPEHTIVRQRYEGRWTWDEFMEAASQTTPSLITSVPHRVDILADYMQSGPLPVGSAMTKARLAMKHLPPNWGVMVIVSESSIINTLVNIFHSMFSGGIGARTFSASSFDDAYRILNEQAQRNVS